MSLTFIGIVVNPKTLAPCAVFKHRERTIAITDEKLHAFGEGYFSGPDDELRYKASEATGFPRFHTPNGLAQTHRKKGYGTVLYASGALAAQVNEQTTLLRGLAVENPGISSNEERSGDASKWWASAHRNNIAYEVSDLDVSEYTTEGEESEDEEDFEEDLTTLRGSEARDAVDAARKWADYNLEGSSSVNDLIVRGTVTTYNSTDGVDAPDDADVLPYEPDVDTGALGVQNIVLYKTCIDVPYTIRETARHFDSFDTDDGDIEDVWNTTLAEVINMRGVSMRMLNFLRHAYDKAGQGALFRELSTGHAGGGVGEDVMGDDADFLMRTNPSKRSRRRNPSPSRAEVLRALNIQAYADLDD